jgi:hypothetical protein
MDITLAEIKRWAGSNDLDDRFAQLQEDDPDGFDHFVVAACDDQTLLDFAKNRNSTKRQFFASALVQRVVFYLYSPHSLPYQFSRFQGMISFDEYKNGELERIENVYRRCRVVDEMRNSEQEEITNIGNMILDYRHDRRLPDANTTKLLRLLNYQIEMSFRPGVTTYQLRLCKSCNDGFKSWLSSGNETESEKCPFCILGITYPQKTGENAWSRRSDRS